MSNTEKSPIEPTVPVSGINEAPESERPKGGPGPGIGCSRPGIR